jgi:hypothetical protein
MKLKREQMIISLLLLLSATIGTLVFSYTTSPLYDFYGRDSACFQTIGKYWLYGSIPYIDAFDQKGPLIFWIDMVGYAIFGTKIGVFFIQILFLVVSEVIAFKILYMVYSKRLSIILSMLMPILESWMMLLHSGGNVVEDYIMPFLFASYYCMLKWTNKIRNNDTFVHKSVYAFIYGLTFGIGLMTRLTSVFGVCIGIAFITIILIIHKEWKNLFCNIGLFLLGAALIIIPFVIYFAIKDAEYEMWYGTLLFNLDYTKSSASNFNFGSFSGSLEALSVSCYGEFLIVVSVYKIILSKKGQKTPLMIWLFISLGNTFLLYNLQSSLNYGMDLIPFAYISFYLLSNKGSEQKSYKNKIIKRIPYILNCCFISGLLLSCILWTYLRYPDKYGIFLSISKDNEKYDNLLKLIPEEEKNDFNAYDCDIDIYLINNIIPKGPYIFFQEWQASFSENFSEYIYEAYDESNVKWILVDRSKYDDLIIDDILDEKYTLVDKCYDGEYELYRLNS